MQKILIVSTASIAVLSLCGNGQCDEDVKLWGESQLQEIEQGEWNADGPDAELKQINNDFADLDGDLLVDPVEEDLLAIDPKSRGKGEKSASEKAKHQNHHCNEKFAKSLYGQHGKCGLYIAMDTCNTDWANYQGCGYACLKSDRDPCTSSYKCLVARLHYDDIVENCNNPLHAGDAAWIINCVTNWKASGVAYIMDNQDSCPAGTFASGEDLVNQILSQ